MSGLTSTEPPPDPATGCLLVLLSLLFMICAVVGGIEILRGIFG